MIKRNSMGVTRERKPSELKKKIKESQAERIGEKEITKKVRGP